MSKDVRLIALYLPQFHPIKENNEWWGAGFTEWTNVAKARKLFPGHYQPHIPRDLGFYDLRLPETRQQQAELAQKYGIEGFCYYHYWFEGKTLLQQPLEDVLISGKPKYPFCICWANETWAGTWHGNPNKILIKQTYNENTDDKNHFVYLKKAFSDERYIKVNGKPLFVIYNPQEIPHLTDFVQRWKYLGMKNGLDLFMACFEPLTSKVDVLAAGFEAVILRNLNMATMKRNSLLRRIIQLLRLGLGMPRYVYSYRQAIHLFSDRRNCINQYFPTVIPNWDNTPRSGRRGLVLHNSTPELFGNHLRDTLKQVENKPSELKIVFIKSWNEWAEGNHLEPDLRYGLKYLEVIKRELASLRS